jgi:hypothetical protein
MNKGLRYTKVAPSAALVTQVFLHEGEGALNWGGVLETFDCVCSFLLLEERPRDKII